MAGLSPVLDAGVFLSHSRGYYIPHTANATAYYILQFTPLEVAGIISFRGRVLLPYFTLGTFQDPPEEVVEDSSAFAVVQTRAIVAAFGVWSRFLIGGTGAGRAHREPPFE